MRRPIHWLTIAITLGVLAAVGLFRFDLPVAATDGGTAGAAAVKSLTGCAANQLARNDDSYTSNPVALPFTANFFGNNYNSLYVNNNGNVTFDTPLATFTPFDLLSTDHVIIAPFFADVDTRPLASGVTTYGPTTFGGHQAFCVNWLGVGYYSQAFDKLNTFQLLLVSRSDIGPGDFDMVFNYNQVQWETGDASGGNGGLGGASARAGYSNGSTTAFELAGSAVNGAFLDSSPSGLVHNSLNSATTGRYIFPVRNGVATGHAISGHIWAGTAGTPAAGAFISACPTPADTACRLATSAGDGSFILSNLPDHTSGGGAVDHSWHLVVNPPGGSNLSPGKLGPVAVNGADVPDQKIILVGPTPLPAGASITTASRGTQTTGVPSTYWQDMITAQFLGCAGGTGTATLLVTDGYTQTVSITEGPSGTYTAVFSAPFPHHGITTISWTISCGSSGSFNIYIDPSGVVLTVDDDPIEGATVTLYRSDDPGGPFEIVPNGSAIMSPSNQTNPDMTDATGHFGWDVLAGYYRVRASMTGCHAPGNVNQAFVETAVLTIPPPVIDLELRLDCSVPSYPPGDSNCSTDVTSIDAAVDLQYAAGLLGSLPCADEADVDVDGDVDSIDAALVLQYTAGLLDHLPV